MTNAFSVNWDYLCPFARNAHEHVLTALEGGAPWEVTFVPFSLVQSHVEEGGPAAWDDPDKAKGVLALQAGVVVRERFSDRFFAVHRAMFAARHDEGRDLTEPEVVRGVLDAAGVDSGAVLKEIDEGWPLEVVRNGHETWVTDHAAFGVPTFVVGDRAVFVRLMTRPGGDAALARTTIDGVLELIDGHPELNEFKFTTIPH